MRIKPTDMPLYTKAGAGLGFRKGETFLTYVPIFTGANYSFSKKLAATASLTIGDGTRITFGIGYGIDF